MAGEEIRDKWSIDTTDAQRGIKAVGEATDKTEKAQGGFRAKLTQLAEGLGEAGDASEPLLLGLNDLSTNLAGGVAGISTFVTAIGTGGLASVLTTAAVGAFTLWQNWDKVVESLTGATEPVGKVKDRLSELEAELEKVKEKRVKLEVDDKAVRDAEDRVKNLRSALDQFKSLAETPSEIESAQAAAVREATAKGGYTGTEGADAIIQEIMRAMGDRSLGGEAGRQRQQQIEDAQAAIDEDQAALDALPRHARMAKHQDDLNARQTELNKQKADREEFMKAQEQDAQELVGKAMQGQSEALQRLQEMAKSGTFNDPFAKAIGAADIESQRRQQNVRQLQEARKADLEQERRQQEQAEAERQQTEDAIRAKRDAELLAKVREGQAVAPEAQAGYLREGEKGAEVRRMELEAAQADAKSKADKEAQQARDKANSEAEAERKRQDTEAEANRKAQIAEAMAINQKFVPNIQYAMGTSGGLPTPQLHQAISRDLGRQGIDPAIQNEVAAQLQEQALKDLRQATASKEAMGLNQQQAFAATIMELARQIRQQMIEGQQIRQELDQARGIIRETRQAIRPTGPSHLPYYN